LLFWAHLNANQDRAPQAPVARQTNTDPKQPPHPDQTRQAHNLTRVKPESKQTSETSAARTGQSLQTKTKQPGLVPGFLLLSGAPKQTGPGPQQRGRQSDVKGQKTLKSCPPVLVREIIFILFLNMGSWGRLLNTGNSCMRY